MRFLPRPSPSLSLLHPPRPTTTYLHLSPRIALAPRTSLFSTSTNSLLKENDEDKKSALMDREAVNTESNEYSKSGSDDTAAQQSDPAFQAGKTDPDSELGSSKPNKSGNDPLDVSPANHGVSQPRNEKEGGAEKGVERTSSSGGSKGESGGMKKGRVGGGR